MCSPVAYRCCSCHATKASASAIAWVSGSLRFTAFMAMTAAAGAAVHLVTHFGELLPMVGASAAISGSMAAAARFAF